MSNIWGKIWGGIQEFGRGVGTEISFITQGIAAGSAIGPEGSLIGGVLGMLAGVGVASYHFAQYLATALEPDAGEVASRLTGSGGQQTFAAMSNGSLGTVHQQTSKNIMNSLQGGSTLRGAMLQSGATQFPSAMAMGGLVGASNRASSTIGVSPITASALGNGALRSAYTGASQYSRGSIYNHILTSSAPISSSAYSSQSAGNYQTF